MGWCWCGVLLRGGVLLCGGVLLHGGVLLCGGVLLRGWCGGACFVMSYSHTIHTYMRYTLVSFPHSVQTPSHSHPLCFVLFLTHRLLSPIHTHPRAFSHCLSFPIHPRHPYHPQQPPLPYITPLPHTTGPPTGHHPQSAARDMPLHPRGYRGPLPLGGPPCMAHQPHALSAGGHKHQRGGGGGGTGVVFELGT